MSDYSFDAGGADPMKVVFFFSGGASSMRAVVESPLYNDKFKVIGAVTNRPRNEVEEACDFSIHENIPVVHILPDKFGSRAEFYDQVTGVVDDFSPDVIGLSGWLRKYSIISDPLLNAYWNRIINVHPANLAVVYNPGAEENLPLYIAREELVKYRSHRSENDSEMGNARDLVANHGWKRMLTGDDAVALAVLLGEGDVRSTVHAINDDVDTGPILTQSVPIQVDKDYVARQLGRGAIGNLVDYSHDLQGKMKTDCDGPAFCKALELLGSGQLSINDNGVKLDGEELPYHGYRLDENGGSE